MSSLSGYRTGVSSLCAADVISKRCGGARRGVSARVSFALGARRRGREGTRAHLELDAERLRERLEAEALARRGDAVAARRAAVLGRQLLRGREAAGSRTRTSALSLGTHREERGGGGRGGAPVQALLERLGKLAARAVADVEAQVEERLERLALVVAPAARDLGPQLAREGAVHDARARQRRVVGVRRRGVVQEVERCEDGRASVSEGAQGDGERERTHRR